MDVILCMPRLFCVGLQRVVYDEQSIYRHSHLAGVSISIPMGVTPTNELVSNELFLFGNFCGQSVE